MRQSNIRIHLASVAALAACCAAPSAMAGTIANWTFETSQPPVSPSPAPGLYAAEVGVGTASGFHASLATSYTSPVGNGSGHSFNSNQWSVGDYYEFRVSTVGQSQIGFLFDQTSSTNGPQDFKVSYSTNGVSFTDTGFTTMAPIDGSPNVAWSATVGPQSLYRRFVDLSTNPAVENQPTLILRIVNNSTTSASNGTVATGGTDRVDNVHVISQVPEPASTLLVLCGLAGFALPRRR